LCETELQWRLINMLKFVLLYVDERDVLARQHNDANIISIPARFTSIPQVLEMVDISTDFEGGRQPCQMCLKSIKSRCFATILCKLVFTPGFLFSIDWIYVNSVNVDWINVLVT
jgi:hypothetical protein